MEKLPKISPVRFLLLMFGALVLVAVLPFLIATVAVFTIEFGSLILVLTRVAFIDREGEVVSGGWQHWLLAILAMMTSCFALATFVPLLYAETTEVVHVVAMLRMFGLATVGGLLFWLLMRRFRGVILLSQDEEKQAEPTT